MPQFYHTDLRDPGQFLMEGRFIPSFSGELDSYARTTPSLSWEVTENWF